MRIRKAWLKSFRNVYLDSGVSVFDGSAVLTWEIRRTAMDVRIVLNSSGTHVQRDSRYTSDRVYMPLFPVHKSYNSIDNKYKAAAEKILRIRE